MNKCKCKGYKCMCNYKDKWNDYSIENSLSDIQLQLLNLQQRQEQYQAQVQSQLQAQAQLQGQAQNDSDTISNVGNPVVNVNVSNNPSSNDNGKSNSIYSAFSASASSDRQPLPGTIPVVKILFPNERFDLEDEYDASTSTFIAKKSGVYLFYASLSFFGPNNIRDPHQVRIQILVNGTAVATDGEFHGGGSGTYIIAVSVSAIVKLNAGDRVEVAAASTVPGVIIEAGSAARFEGARFPSPTE